MKFFEIFHEIDLICLRKVYSIFEVFINIERKTIHMKFIQVEL